MSAAAAGLALQPGTVYCEADEQVSVAALVTVKQVAVLTFKAELREAGMP